MEDLTNRNNYDLQQTRKTLKLKCKLSAMLFDYQMIYSLMMNNKKLLLFLVVNCSFYLVYILLFILTSIYL